MQANNNNLLAKATSDSGTISKMQDYIRALESKVNSLELENTKLAGENRHLKQRERDTRKLEHAVERLSKDKAKLLDLMRQSQEFRLLGNLGRAPSQITHLHSLGFFSEYDVNKIQVKAEHSPDKPALAHAFDSGLRKHYSSVKKGRRGRLHPDRPSRNWEFGCSGNQLKLRPCRAEKLFNEEQMWVDEDLREFVMEMKDRLNRRFSEELMEHLLFRVNSHFLAKVDVFRRSGHLFCKYCRGVPPKKTAKGQSSGHGLDFIKTLKNYGICAFNTILQLKNLERPFCGQMAK